MKRGVAVRVALITGAVWMGSAVAAQRTSAEEMIDGANACLDLFADKLREAPWGSPCERLEGGRFRHVHTLSVSAAKNSPQIGDCDLK